MCAVEHMKCMYGTNVSITNNMMIYIRRGGVMTIHVCEGEEKRERGEEREGWGYTRTSIVNVSTSRIFGSSVNGSESSKNARGQKQTV